MNDIWYQTEDIIELLTTNNGEYDIACAMDFYFRFYDGWVTRDIRGEKIWPSYPHFHDSSARSQQRLGLPIRVFSCWNGVTILDAAPFLTKRPIEFRPSRSAQVYHSECFWICYDFWDAGYTRVLVNSNVIIAYNRWQYHLQRLIMPVFVHPAQALYAWLTTKNYANTDSLPDGISETKNIPPGSASNWRDYL